MPLHPFIAAELVAASDVAATPYHQLPIVQARAQMKEAYARQSFIAMAQVRNLQVPGAAGPLQVRVYSPASQSQVLPLTVFFHGRSFCCLDLDTHDEICCRLAMGLGSMVASVDYRLAPEYSYPAGPDDCLAAPRALVAMAGQIGADASAGACLAAVTALRLRDEGGPRVQALVLWYPVMDHPSAKWPSYERYAQGYGLTAQSMAWYWPHYLAGATEASHPHASPLRATDLRGMPATWLMTAEYDVLCDKGQAFARRLEQVAVPVQTHCALGLKRGLLKHADRLPQAAEGMALACAWLCQIQSAGAGRKWASNTDRLTA